VADGPATSVLPIFPADRHRSRGGSHVAVTVARIKGDKLQELTEPAGTSGSPEDWSARRPGWLGELSGVTASTLGRADCDVAATEGPVAVQSADGRLINRSGDLVATAIHHQLDGDRWDPGLRGHQRNAEVLPNDQAI